MVLMNCAAVNDQERQKFVHEVKRRKQPIKTHTHDPIHVEENKHWLFFSLLQKT